MWSILLGRRKSFNAFIESAFIAIKSTPYSLFFYKNDIIGLVVHVFLFYLFFYLFLTSSLSLSLRFCLFRVEGILTSDHQSIILTFIPSSSLYFFIYLFLCVC